MTHISNTLLIAAPIAPAVTYALVVFSYLNSISHWLIALLGAFAAAIALELVGIFAGHTMLEAWHERNWSITAIAAISLVLYAGFGTMELWHTPVRFLFIVSLIAYVLAGGYRVVNMDKATQSADLAANKQQEQEGVRHKRQMEMLQQKADNQLREQRAEQQATIRLERERVKLEQQKLEDKRERRGKATAKVKKVGLPTTQPILSNKERVIALSESEPQLTQKAIADKIGITRQAVGQHLNAHKRAHNGVTP